MKNFVLSDFHKALGCKNDCDLATKYNYGCMLQYFFLYFIDFVFSETKNSSELAILHP